LGRFPGVAIRWWLGIGILLWYLLWQLCWFFRDGTLGAPDLSRGYSRFLLLPRRHESVNPPFDGDEGDLL